MEGQQDSLAQVRLQFITKDDSVKLPEGIGAILVSSGFKRYALSTLINQLLETEKPVPFEFLINGQFLRTSIDEFLTANGISAEETLTAEYVKASLPPTLSSSFQHDDWISAVDVLSSTSPAGLLASKDQAVPQGQARIVSASYDGILRIWSTSSELIATSNPLSTAIKTCKFFTPTKIVTGGHDRIIRVWDYKQNPSKLTSNLELVGHRASVDSLAVHATSNRILSASSDHTVCLWSSRPSEAPEPPEALLPQKSASKRRKINSHNVTQKGPLAVLEAHSRPVSQAVLDAKDRTIGYSCSWDQSLATYDLTTFAKVSSKNTTQPLLSLVHLKELNLLGAGTTSTILILDPRTDARNVSTSTLRGHTGPVVSLSSTNNPYGLVSASFDGTLRLWDLRSRVKATGGTSSLSESLHIIRPESSKEGNKLFSVCYDNEVGIVSAGEAKRVEVWHNTTEQT